MKVKLTLYELSALLNKINWFKIRNKELYLKIKEARDRSAKHWLIFSRPVHVELDIKDIEFIAQVLAGPLSLSGEVQNDELLNKIIHGCESTQIDRIRIMLHANREDIKEISRR